MGALSVSFLLLSFLFVSLVGFIFCRGPFHSFLMPNTTYLSNIRALRCTSLSSIVLLLPFAHRSIFILFSIFKSLVYLSVPQMCLRTDAGYTSSRWGTALYFWVRTDGIGSGWTSEALNDGWQGSECYFLLRFSSVLFSLLFFIMAFLGGGDG
jgi:hypothetical protein